MLRPDRIGHRSPLTTNRDVIGLAIAATQYGSKFFQGGGVPPFAVTGNFQSAGALSRAADDLAEAVRKAAKEKRQALTLPNGLEIKPIGADPEKSQLVELKRFIIEEVARIYSIPPTFLQDLTHGTFSNTEQQDLHFVKHTIKRWAEQFEQELNLKLFGRRSSTQYAELNMDGLLRGDFKTRMDGYAQGIQNGILTPNEARRQENRPSMNNGDVLLIQGATVPLGSQPVNQPPAEPNGEE
jgi:HK97 family phage portal protein